MSSRDLPAEVNFLLFKSLARSAFLPLNVMSPPQEVYKDNPEIMHQLLQLVVESLDDASRKGVQLICGAKLYPIPIGNKGDWPYLVPCQYVVADVFGRGFKWTPPTIFQECPKSSLFAGCPWWHLPFVPGWSARLRLRRHVP